MRLQTANGNNNTSCQGGVPSGSSSKKSSGGDLKVVQDDNSDKNKYTKEQILANIKPLQGVNKDGSPYMKVKDGLSGKVFNSASELFKYYDV